MNPSLIRNFKAEAAISAFRIVKAGSADGQVLQGGAVSDKLVGVTTDIASAINERCDVILGGIADIEYGGTIVRGEPLTSDANGKAVTAAPGAGTNNRLIGMAVVSGVSGNIGQVNVVPSVMQG